MRTLPRTRFPRITEALRLACTLDVGEAESVIMAHRQGERTSPLLAHVKHPACGTIFGALNYALDLYRGGMLVSETERRRPQRERFTSPKRPQRVLWSGVRTCKAGQADLFE